MLKYYSITEISHLAKQHNLSAKDTNLEYKVEEYHKTVFKEILYGYHLANMEQIKDNCVPFNITRIRKQLGRYGKPQRYWWDWLHVNFPLVNIKSKGNSIQGVSSMAQPKEIPLNIILASANGKEIVQALYAQFDQDCDVDVTPINMYSLENYILASTAQNSQNKTIQTNIKDARTILAIARECDSSLPQVKSHSSFGRTYYKGVNLQNVHKTVRHAALGACYAIDINSSVFNWKYAWVPFKDQLSYTRELIQDKNRVRKHLANLVFGNTSDRSIKTIKQVLTAISFGAKSETRCWFKKEGSWTQGAISEIIHAKALRDKLFNDPWMQQFMNEQDQITAYIGNELAKSAASGEIPSKYLDDLRSERGRISKTKLIAWAYQHSEQQLMAEILKHSRSEVLLQVHDGIYFKSKPDMPSMQTILQQHWPIATLSIETIDNYSYRNRELDAQHLEFIRKETIVANGGVDPRTTGIHTLEMSNRTVSNPHAEPDWESIMMKEFYEHFPKPDENMPAFARNRLHTQ